MAPFRPFVLSATAALGVLSVAFAADPPPADAPEDARLSRSAYSALQKDEVLADLNVGVRVLRDGTAFLWGTAPKADAARAEAILKTMPGVTKVVNTCDPAGAPDPLIARVEAAVKGPAPPTQTAKAEPKPETAKAEPKPSAPAVPSPVPTGAAVSRHTTMMVEKPRVAMSSPASEPVARLLEPVPARPPVDYAAVERVRRADPRFARLTFDQRDGRVVIAGSAADPAVAWELARKIASLVGDRDVVVGRIK